MSQRATRQYLESLQRAGVTHLPKVAPQPAVPEPAAPQPAAKAPAPHAAQSQPPAPKPVTAPPASKASEPVTIADVVAPIVVRETAAPPIAIGPNATIEERQAALTVLSERVAACVKCQELADSRKQTVFGVGNPNARIMFIGEAPGADEDRLGEPFVGAAGQLLDKIIVACKTKREDVYICNILRCRPPGNRNPSPIEAGNCREYLDGQISIVQPEYIVCWGSVAAQNLLNQTTSIGRMRGQFFQYGTAKVVCTYHPSYLLRNPAAKTKVWDDMKFLFGDMGVTL